MMTKVCHATQDSTSSFLPPLIMTETQSEPERLEVPDMLKLPYTYISKHFNAKPCLEKNSLTARFFLHLANIYYRGIEYWTIFHSPFNRLHFLIQ